MVESLKHSNDMSSRSDALKHSIAAATFRLEQEKLLEKLFSSPYTLTATNFKSLGNVQLLPGEGFSARPAREFICKTLVLLEESSSTSHLNFDFRRARFSCLAFEAGFKMLRHATPSHRNFFAPTFVAIWASCLREECVFRHPKMV